MITKHHHCAGIEIQQRYLLLRPTVSHIAGDHTLSVGDPHALFVDK